MGDRERERDKGAALARKCEELVFQRVFVFQIFMKDGTSVDPRVMLSLIFRALSVETCNLAVLNNSRKSLRKAGNHLLSLRDQEFSLRSLMVVSSF